MWLLFFSPCGGHKISCRKAAQSMWDKECFSSPGSRHMHLPSSSYKLRWRTDACCYVLQFPREEGTGQETRRNFQQLLSLGPSLLYDLHIATKLITASRQEDTRISSREYVCFSITSSKLKFSENIFFQHSTVLDMEILTKHEIKGYKLAQHWCQPFCTTGTSL